MFYSISDLLPTALPDGTEKEVDLRLYKNSENETKMMTENKLVFINLLISDNLGHTMAALLEYFVLR